MQIKLLNKENWQVWKALRLEALQNTPEAFCASFEEEFCLSDQKFQDWLEQCSIFGAFLDNQLIGCAGFYCLDALKTKHRGVLWGTYIKPTYRGKGIASHLIDAVIIHARSCVMQLHLTCVTSNTTALKIYQNHGFKIYGTEPRALKIGADFYDEHLMVLEFV